MLNEPATSPDCLLRLAWIAAALDGPAGGRAALAELRALGSSEAWEVQTALGMIDAAVGAGALQQAALLADWALTELAVEPIQRCRVLISAHWASRSLGDYRRADAQLAALEHELDRDDVDGRLRAYFSAHLHLGRAQSWMSLGVLDQAAAELGRATPEAEASDDPATLVASVTAHADLLLLQERRALALGLLDGFLERRGEALAPGLLANVLLQRAVALSELERDESAGGRAEAALRELLADPDLRADLAVRAKLELVDLLLRGEPGADERAEADRGLSLAEVALDGSAGPELQALAAALRARLLLAGQPSEAELERGIEQARSAFDRLLVAWRSAPRQRPGGLGFMNSSYRRMLLAALIELHVARDPSERGLARALDVVLAAQAEGQLVRDLGGGLVDLEGVRRDFLGERHGCLVLVPGRHGAHLFLIDRSTLEHRSLPARVELVPLIEAFATDLFASPDPSSDSGGRLAEQLARSAYVLAEAFVPADVRERIQGWQRLTVIGTELFKGLPIECLPLGPRGELAGLTHAVDNLPSLPLAARLARMQRALEPRTELLLAADLAPPSPSADMELVHEHELRPLLQPLLAPFARGSTVLMGERASWSAISARLAESPAPGLLNLLVHGDYVARRERGACLALRTGTGDRLFSEDIESLGLAPPLVVLSACSAARGPERLGSDNLSHLGGAFLAAGASCVVLTRARIQLGPTLRLDQALHEELARGVPVAEALRRARVAALDGAQLTPFLVGRVQAQGLGDARLGPGQPGPLGR